MTRIFVVLLLIATLAYGQAFDAPSAIQPPKPAEHWYQKRWDYPNVPTRQVLKSKALWGTVGGDFLISSFDAEMSHEGYAHHRCVEGSQFLPNYASRWQLYENNLKENSAVAIVSFVWLKVKGPKPILPGFLISPAVVHIRAGMNWYDNCW